MEDKMLKFYLIFAIAVIALTYLVTQYLVGVLGTFAFVLPGVFAIAGFWIAKKFSGSPKV